MGLLQGLHSVLLLIITKVIMSDNTCQGCLQRLGDWQVAVGDFDSGAMLVSFQRFD